MISEFLMKIPFVDDFEIETKAGVKCSEKAVRYREEGNKLFQDDKCTQVRCIHWILSRYTQVYPGISTGHYPGKPRIS